MSSWRRCDRPGCAARTSTCSAWPSQPYFSRILEAAGEVPGLVLKAFGPFDPNGLAMLLEDVDVVVVPSVWWETYSIVIREAYACGIPVVASRLGALPEGVREGENGLLFEAGSSGQLADLLQTLDSDRGLLGRLRDGIRPSRLDLGAGARGTDAGDSGRGGRPARSGLPTDFRLRRAHHHARRAQRVRSIRVSATRGRSVALSALRVRLDEGSARSRWLVDPDGIAGRVLELSGGDAYTVPLSLGGPVVLSARAMLYPHDWRDLAGAVRAAVAVSSPAADRRQLWARVLRAGDRGRPTGFAVSCELPADATALTLELHPMRRPPANGIARAVWVAPMLSDPAVPSRPAGAAAPARLRSAGTPLISVLMPVHDPLPQMLSEAVESVRGQTLDRWELCLSDDGSTDPAVIGSLERYAADDPRIKLTRHPTARGISAATNAALGLAQGEYVALLDHDDTLAPDALERVAAALAAEPDLDMLYTDEDIVDGGRQVWVHLKPAWSPDTLRTNGYTCHLGVYRRTLVQEIGGFRSQFDGSQDIDMILRLTERSERVAHVPGILYHWRAHSGSTAGADAKPYAYVAARRAYADHLRRTGVGGQVGYGPPGLYRLATETDAAARVEIVIATPSVQGLESAVRSWGGQDHDNWALTLAVPRSTHAEIASLITRAGVAPDRTTIAAADGDLTDTLARLALDAAERAAFLLLLPSPVAGLTHGWLSRLLSYVLQPGVGVAGPIVLAADGRVAHGGIALPGGVPLPLLHGTRTSIDDFFGYGTSVYNVSAVSGALLTPSPLFRALGGLDHSARSLALAEYCVRAGDAGERIVTVPDVRMRLTAGDDADNDLPAMWSLADRWSATHDSDPFYNPGYRTDRGDFQVIR